MKESPLEVLLIDDDEDYFVLIEDLLSEINKQEYALSWVPNFQSGLSALCRNATVEKPFDVCLLDYNLGGPSGLELLRKVVETGCKTPIIMLTAQGDHDIDVEAMKIGAADYLSKRKTDSDILERVIRYSIDRAKTLETLRENEKTIADLYQQEQERSKELAHAYVDLRQVETMRDDLTRMIIHDMRSPLTVIGNSLDMIKQAEKNEIMAKSVPVLLDGARSAVKRIVGMIEDLLHVSKFEAGEMRPMFRIIATRNLLQRKEETFLDLAEKEHKNFTLNIADELPNITADEDLIERVLDNLVNNAFKYTEDNGHIQLTASVRGKSLLIKIEDDGQGIPPEYHHRIFDKFVQVTSSEGEPLRKGTGLGLAFCRLAIEAHGGEIWVESEPEKGSVFYFTLPLAPALTPKQTKAVANR
ncbi:MAG: hybrid sensor histidine kinase/response regulator [Candidatus Promineifilaceae bacterium]